MPNSIILGLSGPLVGPKNRFLYGFLQPDLHLGPYAWASPLGGGDGGDVFPPVQSPVHGTCVWLCILCLGVQTGNDVRESGRGTRGMTSHCCVWLCLRWLKFFRHRDTGTKVVYFGAFVTIGARRLCSGSCREEGTRSG